MTYRLFSVFRRACDHKRFYRSIFYTIGMFYLSESISLSFSRVMDADLKKKLWLIKFKKNIAEKRKKKLKYIRSILRFLVSNISKFLVEILKFISFQMISCFSPYHCVYGTLRNRLNDRDCLKKKKNAAPRLTTSWHVGLSLFRA